MKRHFLTRLVAFTLAFWMLISNGFTLSAGAIEEKSQMNTVVTNNETQEANESSLHQGEYNEGVVLVKVKDSFRESDLGELDYTSVEPLYHGSMWYVVTLAESVNTVESVEYLSQLGTLENVDYDYVMEVTADMASIDVSHNPHYGNHKHHHTHKVPESWQYATDNGKQPGGSSDVVIAVIDTGVDYKHEDLRNNIWINTAEIPNNRKDDDGNGYIDDVYGWDCVGNDKDPMDDNGHGTHVAGIIAAENNNIGGVGIAYNCKIMVLKAGNSSGYFNNTDIAEAIQYAYMNGASVINMSFGGSSISVAVEEALEIAYEQCVLVAAAGNDAFCNQPGCPEHAPAGLAIPFYPAALPYVIGVMSTNQSGDAMSSFSNYDHFPYNNYEYEVYAVGEGVYSCWPGNKYTSLNGTSMAAPAVSAIAGLLRSYYTDRDKYSSKFIQSQIVNTGTLKPDGFHAVSNAYEAMAKLPNPAVSLYDSYIDDSTSISDKNNGNGVIDAGETIRLYFSLLNRGGVATDVQVAIDTMQNNNPTLTDSYFTFVNPSMQLSDIGTYSERKSGAKYFEIIVSPDCPNNYVTNFNILFTYKNGMDANDQTDYIGNGVTRFNVSRGYHLPSVISEDTIFEADRLYIVGEDVVIPEGITVTFEEGCEIQFYDDREYYSSPQFLVYGTLIMNGSDEHNVSLNPGERHNGFKCILNPKTNGVIELRYVHATNLDVSNMLNKAYDSKIYGKTNIENSVLSFDASSIKVYVNGEILRTTGSAPYICVNNIKNSAVGSTFFSLIKANNIEESYISILHGNMCKVECQNSFSNNIVCSYSENKTAGESYIKAKNIVENNYFISKDENNTSNLINLNFIKKENVVKNAFNKLYRNYAGQVISDYFDTNGIPTVDVYGSLSDASKLWPYVVGIEMFDADGNPTTTVGKEKIKVRVTFNRPMDTSKDTYLTFGTIEPYADYRINGGYVLDTVWEGTYTLKAQIENGQNFLKVENACAAEDQTKTVFGEYQLHEFTIDTTVAMSSSIVANSTSKGIELSWMQDDYDTLMGYNIYRAESENGDYVKINPAVVLDAYSTYTDADVEAGKTYWYTFTTVLSDFTESLPAGKVSAVAMDTIPPTITHTPVTSGYLNRNINIYCNASDNIAVTTVTLHFRAIGETQWHTRNMSKAGDRYGATIYGSETTLAGFEYYIVASDGNCNGFCGGVNDAFRVNIAHASEDHTFGGDWLANEDGHWQKCTVCGEKGAVKAHKPGAAATETTPQVCTECGFVLKAALGHTHAYSTTYHNNDQMHWFECACGAKTSVGDHVFDNACDPDCNTCGYTIARAHLYDNDCDPRCNKCGETRETEHKFDDGVVTKEPTTTKYGEKTYTCTICGEEKHEDIPMLKEEEKNPGDEQPKGGCYIATCVYGSYDCSEVWTLRRFRDNTLASTWLGRAFVHTYYAVSPTLVDWFGDDAWFQTIWRGALDLLVGVLNAFGVEDTAYEDKVW